MIRLHKKCGGGYFPSHDENRMRQEGNVKAAREYFLKKENRILYHLIEQRYSWMNRYIHDTDRHVIELGCGAGLSAQFITNRHLVLTDVTENDWVDQIIDAMDMDYPDNFLDVIICSHMIHHLANPARFLEHAGNKLRTGGRLIIQDIYTGGLMKLALRAMRHEGYSDSVDVFDRSAICNSPQDPWSANCSIPKLLFYSGSADAFEREFPMYKMRKREKNECFLFFLSGGVIAKTWHLPVGDRGVGMIRKLDRLCIRCFPAVFAGGCSVVLEKCGSDRQGGCSD